MHIIILGAGRVGSTLVEELVREGHDITVVDIEVEKLISLQTKYDIRTIEGQASHPDVLSEAGAEDADMLIAVTTSDETNIISCELAYSIFHIPMKIARIRANSYMQHPKLFKDKIFAVDVVINPEQLITDYITRLMKYPGALQVLDFADGKLQLVGVQTDLGGPLVGKSIDSLSEYLVDVKMRVAAIFRQNRSVPLRDKTVIEANDEIFFIATPSHISKIINGLGKLHLPYKRIIIAGGGYIGSCLAKTIEHDYHVKLIETNPEKASKLSNTLDRTIVLQGDASDKDLLKTEEIENTDVFCAVTDDDEANIMSSLQSKKLGVRTVMTMINRASYVDLIEGSSIDVAISPQQITISELLMHIRQADIKCLYSLRRGAAEAIEIVAHGEPGTSKVVGKVLHDIKLPPGTIIGAIVRDNKVLITDIDDVVIAPHDHVILFVLDKKYIPDVEKLFQVSFEHIE